MSEPLLDDLIHASLQQSPELHVHMLAQACIRRDQRIARLEAQLGAPERAAWLTIDEMEHVIERGYPVLSIDAPRVERIPHKVARALAEAIAAASVAKGREQRGGASNHPVCRVCGQAAYELPTGVHLKRANEFGDPGIWQCSETCEKVQQGGSVVMPEMDWRTLNSLVNSMDSWKGAANAVNAWIRDNIQPIPADQFLGKGDRKIAAELLAHYEELYAEFHRPTSMSCLLETIAKIDALRSAKGEVVG